MIKAIKKWLSAYSIHYPRSIVYMLQASEYDVSEYFSWLWSVEDFSQVEKRKHFERTAKGVLLLIIAWVMILSSMGKASFLLWLMDDPVKYLIAAFIVVILPYVVSYGIIVPLLLVKVIQAPIEGMIISQARKKIKNHPAIKIGIAGSYGKTTMREILKTVLSEGKKVAASPKNYNTPLGISRFVKSLKGDEDVLIFELGEYYPGDIKRLCELTQPDMGIITGVNEAHLQKFKSIDKTTATVFELADYLKNKPVFVNGENKHAREASRDNHIIYSRDGIESWKIKNKETDISGISFMMEKDGKEIDLKSNLLGLHQIGPLALAAYIALKMGLSTEEIRQGIGKTRPFDHRMEPKESGEGVITLDDSYNGNPDGVRAVIDFLASLKDHRRIYVTPGLVEMGDRKEEIHRQIGRELAEAGIEKVILVKNSVTPFIEEGLKEKEYKGSIEWFPDALAAFAALPYITVKEDVVLLQNDWPDQYR